MDCFLRSDVVPPSLETAETVPYIIPDTPTYDEVADVAAGKGIQCPKLESSSNSDSRIQFVSVSYCPVVPMICY